MFPVLRVGSVKNPQWEYGDYLHNDGVRNYEYRFQGIQQIYLKSRPEFMLVTMGFVVPDKVVEGVACLNELKILFLPSLVDNDVIGLSYPFGFNEGSFVPVKIRTNQLLAIGLNPPRPGDLLCQEFKVVSHPIPDFGIGFHPPVPTPGEEVRLNFGFVGEGDHLCGSHLLSPST